jgi:citrate lyase subunit beta/citryl-CoA lyase
VIHDAFAPSQEEIQKAIQIVAAFEEAQRNGLAVVSLGSKMIDPPVVHRAAKLVQQARAMGVLPAGAGSTEGGAR